MDFSQFFLYITYMNLSLAKLNQKPNQIEQAVNIEFLPHVKFALIVMVFAKILFYVRVYKDYGFIVSMLFLTIKKLAPFFYGFAVSLLFFALCSSVLEQKIDDDYDDLDGGDDHMFSLLLLQMYR